MARDAEYADLVVQAEQAVAGVKDPELRRIAYQKILENLLEGAPASKGKKSPKAKATRRSKSTKTAASRSGPQAYVEELVDEGFFKKPKTISSVKAELENRGHHIPLTSLSGPLQKLCQRKVLRRQRTTGSGKKQTFSYSEW